jgi:hypothetical protein
MFVTHVWTGAGAYKVAYDATGHLVISKTATNAQIFTTPIVSANPGKLQLQVGGYEDGPHK